MSQKIKEVFIEHPTIKSILETIESIEYPYIDTIDEIKTVLYDSVHKSINTVILSNVVTPKNINKYVSKFESEFNSYYRDFSKKYILKIMNANPTEKNRLFFIYICTLFASVTLPDGTIVKGCASADKLLVKLQNWNETTFDNIQTTPKNDSAKKQKSTKINKIVDDIMKHYDEQSSWIKFTDMNSPHFFKQKAIRKIKLKTSK